jgi:hypothetical protein
MTSTHDNAQRLDTLARRWNRGPTPQPRASAGLSTRVAKRKRVTAEATQTLQSDEMQTAVLALIGSARLLHNMGYRSTAVGIAWELADLGLRVRVRAHLGKGYSREATILDVLNKLRSGLVIKADQYRAVRKILLAPEDTAEQFERLIELVRECLSQ